MILPEQNLTKEERRALGIAALTTIVTATVAGAIQWGFEEAKAALQRRRARRAQQQTAPSGMDVS